MYSNARSFTWERQILQPPPPSLSRNPEEDLGEKQRHLYPRASVPSVRLASKINCHSGRTINEPSTDTLSFSFRAIASFPENRIETYTRCFVGRNRCKTPKTYKSTPSSVEFSEAYQTSEGGFVISRLLTLLLFSSSLLFSSRRSGRIDLPRADSTDRKLSSPRAIFQAKFEQRLSAKYFRYRRVFP